MVELKPLFTWRSAIADSDLEPKSRHVALTISLHMNERGGSCFPSLETLAGETGLNKRQVSDGIKDLETSGYLKVTRGGGRGKPNRYEAIIPMRISLAEVNRRLEIAMRVEAEDVDASHAYGLGQIGGLKGAEVEPFKNAESDGNGAGVEPFSDLKGADVGTGGRNTENQEKTSSSREQRNAIWDALLAAGFASPSNAAARSRRGKVVKLLLESGATPDEIERRAAELRRRWGEPAFTDTALASRWDDLATNTGGVGTSRPDVNDGWR